MGRACHGDREAICIGARTSPHDRWQWHRRYGSLDTHGIFRISEPRAISFTHEFRNRRFIYLLASINFHFLINLIKWIAPTLCKI